MPGPLRRLHSCLSIESVETPRSIISKADDFATPHKRRRLVIKGASTAASPPKSCNPLLAKLETGTDVVAKTPSRADGVSEGTERLERMLVCEAARDAVFKFCRAHGYDNSKIGHDQRMRAQVLACYLIQVFFMSASLRKEDHGVVAIAAAITAVKAFRMECTEEDVMQLCGEESDAGVAAKISLVEARLLESLGTPSPGKLSHFDGPLQNLTVHLLKAEHGFPHISESELKKVTSKVILDAFYGLAPVMISPEALVGGALALATVHLHRRSSACFSLTEDELISLLCSNSSWVLTRDELKLAVDEIRGVYRAWLAQGGATRVNVAYD